MRCLNRIGLAIAFGLGAGLDVAGSTTARADAVGGEIILLSSHIQEQRDAFLSEYKRKLDRKGRHVITPGVEVYYDNALDAPFWGAEEIRTSGGLLQDSVTHWFGYFAVMGRWVLHDRGRFSLSLDAGPGFIVRETWRDIPGYHPDNPMEESDRFLPGYEYKFLILGEVDLLYRLAPNLQGVWSIVPGIPYVILQSLGLRWAL